MSSRDQRARERHRRQLLRATEFNNQEGRSLHSLAQRMVRGNEEYRELEQERNRAAHVLLRQNQEYREQEQGRDRAAHVLLRQNHEYREQEQQRNSAAYRTLCDQTRDVSWYSMVEYFKENCREGPSHTCVCCGGLWFKKSMKHLRRSDCTRADDNLLNSVFPDDALEGEFCTTCYGAVRSGRISRLALNNGLDFPLVPPEVSSLTRLEARLVSPYHVFQAIWAVQGDQGQLKTKGRIVNVPVSVTNIVQSLPRLPSDDSVLHLRLARQMHIERNYTSGNIRPEKVIHAAEVLCKSPLFSQHGVSISHSWLADSRRELTLMASTLESELEKSLTITNEANAVVENEDSTATETMLTDGSGLRMAPAEGNRPISVLLDDDAIFLAFPQLFGGHKLTPICAGKKLSRADMFKSFARNKDRRAAESIDFLLYMAKTLEIARITSNRTIHLRKRRVNGELIVPSAGQVLHQNYVDGLIRDDNAYKVLAGIRNAGTHWKNEGNKVRAMIRTFGIATLFVTVSAAELKWNELIVLLKKILDGVDISEEDAQQLPSSEKAMLIQRDPITCARYFDHRYSALKATYKSRNGPFGSREIRHFYERVEFQHRGSPHVHAMYWLADAPVYNPENKSQDEVTDFIDSIITCNTSYPDDDPITGLLSLQTHRHTHTCYKRTHKGIKCRFGIPFFPMDRTRILLPLNEADDLKELHVTYKAVREFLDSRITAEKMSFEEFLARISCDLTTYLRVIQSKLKKPHVYLKRSPCEIYINAYSEKILRLQQSNMDIQFILDPYACCSYIVDYINKSNRGLSELLRNVVEEVRKGNAPLKDSLQAIGAAHNLNSELSAQEAAYNVLQMPMSYASEKCVFIQTGPASHRTRMLKPLADLSQMDPDDQNIFFNSPTDHYAQRPLALESLNLAQFSAWYEYSKTLRRPTVDLNEETATATSEETGTEVSKLIDNSGYIRKRKFPKAIRFVRYNKEKDPDNFFRELLMLYKPWRDEEKECSEDVDCQKIVAENLELIAKNRQEFNFFEDSILDSAMEEVIARPPENEVDLDENPPSTDELREYRLEDASGANAVDFASYERRPFAESFKNTQLTSNDEYWNLLATLNDEQRDLVYHAFDQVKRHDSTPFQIYLKGGAGVGKSHCIKTLHQGLIRIFNSDVHRNPDKISVLLVAPTGKAAFHIGGSTLHTAFQLPVNQREAGSLSADVSNTMAATYSELKIVICDEISMVGEHLLEQVDKRLRDLFNPTSPFGGLSFIAVGDFYQLPPVLAVPLTHGSMSNSISSLFHRPLWHHFLVHELTIIMRQNEDIAFAVALNNMARGIMTEDDKTLMRGRCYDTLPSEVAELRPIHFFHTNAAVTAFNDMFLQQMPGELILSRATDTVRGDVPQTSKVRLLQRFQTKPLNETMGLPLQLQLKINARYMMTANVDCSDGLVNGVTGMLRRIDLGVAVQDPNDRIPLRLWLEFEDTRSGQQLRRRYESIVENLGIETSWTPVELLTQEIHQKNASIKITRKQFPLVPAEAITIHKSQGITCQAAVLHLNHTHHISRALIYVGCSRPTKASGLYIVGDFRAPKPITPTSPLALEMARHETMKLLPVFRSLRQREDGLIQFLYHNVQSLPKHSALYSNDAAFKFSDILLFVETWTLANDKFKIGDHIEVCSVDCEPPRRPMGARIYLRQHLAHRVLSTTTKYVEGSSGSCSCVGLNFSGTNVIGIYISPSFRWTSFVSTLLSAITSLGGSRTIVAGDFNCNFKLTASVELRSMLDLGLELQSPELPTTKFGTKIDAVFASFQLDKIGLYTSATSIHEPIWGRFS